MNTVGIAGEDVRGAVALMDVEVDDRGAPDRAVALEHAHGHRQVVDVTEAFGRVGEGVVEAAADADAAAARHRVAPGERRTAGGEIVSAHDLAR